MPLVFEAGGRPAEDTAAFVRSWGAGLDDAERSRVIRYAWQQYSCVLQAGNAEMILSAIGQSPEFCASGPGPLRRLSPCPLASFPPPGPPLCLPRLASAFPPACAARLPCCLPLRPPAPPLSPACPSPLARFPFASLVSAPPACPSSPPACALSASSLRRLSACLGRLAVGCPVLLVFCRLVLSRGRRPVGGCGWALGWLSLALLPLAGVCFRPGLVGLGRACWLAWWGGSGSGGVGGAGTFMPPLGGVVKRARSKSCLYSCLHPTPTLMFSALRRNRQWTHTGRVCWAAATRHQPFVNAYIVCVCVVALDLWVL